MRKFTTIALASMFCSLMLLSGCRSRVASGSAASSDAPLGRVPAIFAEVAAEEKSLNEALPEMNDVKKMQEAMQEFNEYAARSYQKAEEEAQKIIGRDILCTGDVYPDFKITGAQVTDYHAGDQTGSFTVRVMVTPKHDLTVRANKYQCGKGEYSLADTRLYFILMTADDYFIDLGELNPFSSNTYLSQKPETEYSPGQMILADVPCHSEGAPLWINCHSTDFTKFAKIVFVQEKDYMAIRQQVYGF